MADGGASAKKVVSMAPWRHGALNIGKLSVKGRTQWGGGEPIWKNELVYYNKVAYPLENTFKTIIIHHTNNTDSIDSVEKKQQSKGYAAIGYAFFIDQSGVIYEGRPLEVMGSNAGQGLSSGPLNDPDWGSVGIALQGDFEHETFDFNDDDVTTKQLQALEDLVVALRGKYGINKLIMHREVKRKGKATVCPGSHLVPHVEALRKKIGISGP
jgi:N-acetyl-anhydromuramyl-L-alanine amidase AmpD